MSDKHPPFILLPFDIMTDSRMTLRHIKVLMAIYSWRKTKSNTVRISRCMISERSGYLPNRVSKITSELVNLGWLTKSGNLGKKQWSVYELKSVLPKTGTTPLPKTGTTPLPKTGTTPLPKTGTSIDTEVIDTEVIDTVKNIKKSVSCYENDVNNFAGSEASASVFKSVYPLLGKNDYLSFITQFKDMALNRSNRFKNLDAGFRNYINRKYITPVQREVRKNLIPSFRDIGDTVRAVNDTKAIMPPQILIENKE